MAEVQMVQNVSALQVLSADNVLYFCYAYIKLLKLRLIHYWSRQFNRVYTLYIDLTLSLSTALPFSGSQFLASFEKEFLDSVYPKQSMCQLLHEGVISPDVKIAIDRATDEEAKYILLTHLQKYATVDTLKKYCNVAIAAKGYARMQELGEKMMAALPPGG